MCICWPEPKMVSILLIFALVSLTFSSPLDQRDSSVCSSGLYVSLIPYVQNYPPAQSYCTQYFPVSCTLVPNHKRVVATTVTTSKSTPKTPLVTTTTTSSINPTSSAWSRCLFQAVSFVSTICSCIEKPTACAPRTSTTTINKPTTTVHTLRVETKRMLIAARPPLPKLQQRRYVHRR
jgi:hypothetical protein